VALTSVGTTPEPLFKTLQQAHQQLRTKEVLTFPIFSLDGKTLLHTLQVVSRLKPGSRYSQGFSVVDEVFITLVGNLVRPKLI
jgi:hypothetical protein